jgi:hypothetical protein
MRKEFVRESPRPICDFNLCLLTVVFLDGFTPLISEAGRRFEEYVCQLADRLWTGELLSVNSSPEATEALT